MSPADSCVHIAIETRAKYHRRCEFLRIGHCVARTASVQMEETRMGEWSRRRYVFGCDELYVAKPPNEAPRWDLGSKLSGVSCDSLVRLGEFNSGDQSARFSSQII